MSNLLQLLYVFDDVTKKLTVNNKKRRKRKSDSDLLFHNKRTRVLWHPFVRALGPLNFKVHHRISLTLFNKIHSKIKKHIFTDPKYVRKSCCSGHVSHIDSRSRLSMTLKHLAGSKMQDIQQAHGVSRSSVVHAINITMDAIIKEFGIPPFPFDDREALQKLADGFKKKSTGGLFTHLVCIFDGLLLKISKRCIGKNSGIKDPSKYYCRKGHYAINCQVGCDADRKVISLSMLSPGAVPDRLAHVKSSIHRCIETGRLPEEFYFGGDNAYPTSEQMLTPFTRQQMRNDFQGWMDNYNFYFSQLRINIECCFGMIINKFPILLAALLTPRIDTACKTFNVCCCLHNLCIDERLSDVDDVARSFPPRRRYTQVNTNARGGLLTEESDFAFVDVMDEVGADELMSVSANVGPQCIEEDTTQLSRKEKMMFKIAAKGYIRPKKTN